MSRELVEIVAELKDDMEKSWFVFDGRVFVHLPKSLCEYDPDSRTFLVPEWLAKKEGLI